MTMRLIDADALIKEYCDGCEFGRDGVCDCEPCGKVCWVSEAPTIDPESLRPQWIPVTEQMPESMEWVLCLLTDKSIDVLRYDHIMDDWDRKIPNRGYGKKVVTHWMPPPELRCEDESEG